MSPSKLTIAAALACLAFVSGCNGCHDEEAFACQSNADCTHGRWCIEEQCTSEPLDSGSLQEPHPDGGPMTTPDASRTDGSTNSPGVPTTPTDSMVEDYCEAEATCIDVCARVGGSVACDSTVRTDECAADFLSLIHI